MKRNTPTKRHLGAKIKYYREKKGLTQEELAAQLQVRGCDLSRISVGHIECGHRTTSIYEIDKLVEVLGVDYNALFAEAQESGDSKKNHV